MNHWDLNPGETVTLARLHDGHRLSAAFRFRTTRIAMFLIEHDDGKLEYREYYLRDDGGLEAHIDLTGRQQIDVLWRIATARANTRGIAAGA
jgi:hypothetical protein